MRIREIVKRVPGAVPLYERVWQLAVGMQATYLRLLQLATAPFSFSIAGPRDLLVAVTVSTNYSDLLKICLAANKDWFGKWIVVTDKTDSRTLAVLSAYPDIVVLFWDPKRNGAAFDKGSGLRLGQKYAYKHYPRSWYVVIDSDIVLEGEPGALRKLLPDLSPEFIHGIERWDYASMGDLTKKINGSRYPGSENFHGYFQLYAVPYLYSPSRNASVCDLRFLALFPRRRLLETISCSHLGQESHWLGRPESSKDFVL